ncbi:hypothetical protein J5N97_002212 [Dioscorea zingiberensis]|uniref:Uncharacterized protein n=1 Tax=Dioscorea zingiberensis TaxID=325984 RepID=A0A9D5D1T1_9LILI|nr:hypothetical protein J5N97_002212 [Dioscorea zingiberensis]
MASNASSSASASRSEPSAGLQIPGMDANHLSQDVLSIIDSLKMQVIADRCIYIKKKMEDNKQKLSGITHHVHNLTKLRRNAMVDTADMDSDLLRRRHEDAVGTINNLELSGGDKYGNGCQDESSYGSSVLLFGNNHVGKCAIRTIKLPEVPKLPPYTTWIFLDRNQRMTEDQSVVGRRRIYYDQSCGEALICSDSEEDIIEDEEEKKEFGNIEDYILRMTLQEVGASDNAVDSLAEHLERKPSEIRARYGHFLKTEKTEQCVQNGENRSEEKLEDALLEKDLDAALDSFDNLFCRRCLVFDCRLHGCSQDLVFPAEKQLPWNNSDDGTPCSNHCYRLASKSDIGTSLNSHTFEELTHSSGGAGQQNYPSKKIHGSSVGQRVKSHQSESASSNVRIVSESSESEVHPWRDSISTLISSSPLKVKTNGKCSIRKRNNKRAAERVLICIRKRQKKLLPPGSEPSGTLWLHDMKLRSTARKGNKDINFSSHSRKLSSSIVKKCRKKVSPLLDNVDTSFVVPNEFTTQMVKQSTATVDDESSRKDDFVDEKHEINGVMSWKTIEKGLFGKGLEIYGRNSCLISRNLLNGMRTCSEVFQYMNFIENKGTFARGNGANSLVEGHGKGNELRTRSRFLRRRGRVRRLKYTWKSAGYHSIRKRITEREDQPCRQYNPCGCQSACGKQCPCILNGTCCEKYCGCPKICKNRFRGCHCAKSQCRSRQCPCFAADRECDPDVCRNCWVGCGDGTLGGPTQRGDNYECRNMKLLLKQQQRVLLGRSDVSGWGAFLKNSVGKHEYLGEYTGELISHREADKRGKIYDRENSSFLFNLNDQFVLDAYRKGDKLKFANHSPDPNCYAKVIMVAGDHRVGIFAKERISAGEELFYDYRYEPDRAPAWARKPESSCGKKDDSFPSSGRAKKLA